MTSTSIGRHAEDRVAKYLEDLGHKIISKNWRTRYCEIDIVSDLNQTIYFTEVKYRSSSAQGSGIEYITSKKLKQMKFAAEFWIAESTQDYEYQLLVAEVNAENKIRLTTVD